MNVFDKERNNLKSEVLNCTLFLNQRPLRQALYLMTKLHFYPFYFHFEIRDEQKNGPSGL